MHKHQQQNKAHKATGEPPATITTRPSVAENRPQGMEQRFRRGLLSEVVRQHLTEDRKSPVVMDGVRTGRFASCRPGCRMASYRHDKDRTHPTQSRRAREDTPECGAEIPRAAAGGEEAPYRGDVRGGRDLLEGQAGHGSGFPSPQTAPWEGLIFADASFLVALFAGTEHSKEARQWWKRSHAVITISSLVLFEAQHSIRSLHLSRKIKRADARWANEHMTRRILEGMVEVRELSNKRVYPAARRLSIHYGENRSFGAMDIVHVATAQELAARGFLTFDNRQRELAEAEGMHVMP